MDGVQFAMLGDGRRLAFDDLGRRDGAAVVYLHGAPSCRAETGTAICC